MPHLTAENYARARFIIRMAERACWDQNNDSIERSHQALRERYANPNLPEKTLGQTVRGHQNERREHLERLTHLYGEVFAEAGTYMFLKLYRADRRQTEAFRKHLEAQCLRLDSAK